jgi:hypothetical protein
MSSVMCIDYVYKTSTTSALVKNRLKNLLNNINFEISSVCILTRKTTPNVIS